MSTVELLDPATDPEAIEREAVLRARGTAHVLAGLMVLGLLEHAEGPAGLLGTLFPTAEGMTRDRAQFLAGAITGAAVEARRNQHQQAGGWSGPELRAAAAVLAEAGYQAMADLADQAAWLLPEMEPGESW